MEFEVLKRSRVKRNIIIAVIVVLIISAIILNFTRAKYRSVSSVPIINSEINYKVPDLNMVSLYVANEDGIYVEEDTIPTSGYGLNQEKSYCGQSNNGEIIKDDTVSIVYESGSVSVNNITKKGTKCYLYFDKKQTVGEGILSNYTNLLTRNDFSTIVTETTTGTIYYADSSKGRTYYFAGNPTDNWVQFAGFYWRIIRINEDGSIRIIYSGDSSSGPVTTGESTQIGTNSFNSLDNNNMYVGYMYQNNRVHGLTTNSTIKRVLDTWYEENLLENYADRISTETGFCGDRTSTITNGGAPNDTGGTGTTTTYYGARYRLYTNKTPTFECPDVDNDLYTISSSSQGNHALDYPIGLITADEAVYAGGGFAQNTNYYLYTNSAYWTMSPSSFSAHYALVHALFAGGFLNTGNGVDSMYGVRPVINLSPDVTITGSGTISDPYQVVGT